MNRLRLVCLFLLLATAAFSLATRLAPFNPNAAGGGSPFTSFLLDGVREALAAKSMETADRYFHLGRGHIVEEAFTNTVFQRLGERLSPRRVVHREGDAIAEILPWLWLSTQLDSSNLNNILTASYWLHASNHPRQAAELLAQAQQRMGPNPAIYLAQARMALVLGKTAAATAFLNSGLNSLHSDAAAPGKENPDNTRRQLLNYRGYLHEIAGETNAAVRVYQQLIAEQPKQFAGLTRRVEALRSGLPVSPSAAGLLRAVLHVAPHCHRHGHGAEHAYARESHEAPHEEQSPQ